MSVIARRPLTKADLELVVSLVEVRVVCLDEQGLEPGDELKGNRPGYTSLFYCLDSGAQLIVEGCEPVALFAHTLAIVPSHSRVTVEAIGLGPVRVLVGSLGACETSVIDLFGILPGPIVETFTASDPAENNLRTVMEELNADKLVMAAMTTLVLKQLVVIMLRRSLVSRNALSDQLTLLTAPQMQVAMAAMSADPSANHTVEALARVADQTPDAFIQQFTAAFGTDPLAFLKRLRLVRSAKMLVRNTSTVGAVAHAVGFRSRSRFTKAFHDMFGRRPSDSRPRHYIG